MTGGVWGTLRGSGDGGITIISGRGEVVAGGAIGGFGAAAV